MVTKKEASQSILSTTILLEASNTRINSLDFLRGLAACAVMLFHYTGETSINLSESNPIRLIGVNGHYGVQAFFILSGIVIPYSMHASGYTIRAFGKFVLKRTIRIHIPYLAIIGIELLLIFFSSLTPWRDGISERLAAFDFTVHMLYLNEFLGLPWLLPVFWTLAIEFQFYLLIAILYPFFLQGIGKFRILLMAVLASLSSAFPQSYLLFSHIHYFLLGIALFQILTGVITYHEYLITIAALLFLLFLRDGLNAVVLATTLIGSILYLKCNWSFTSSLGIISYSIYLIHIPFGGRLLVMIKTYVQSELLRTISIIVIFILTIFLGHVFYLLVEKPAIQLAKRLKYKNARINSPLTPN